MYKYVKKHFTRAKNYSKNFPLILNERTMCDEERNPCCEAINRALGTFELQLADVAARGSAAIIAAGFPAPTAVDRSALATAAIAAVRIQFRAAITRLIALSQECKNSCCQAAALALRDTAIGIANLIVVAAADPNIPLATALPAPAFNLAFVLANLVGNAAFPPATIGLPTPAVVGSLADSLNLILTTIICAPDNNDCDPCDDRIHVKPGRKISRSCKNGNTQY